MEKIDKKELQGVLVRGYDPLKAACYLLLKIKSPAAVKSWLAAHHHQVTPGHLNGKEPALNIAFTLEGLRTLGLTEDSLATFPFEFQEGMNSPHRQFLLGDYGHSAPGNWNWGGTNSEPVHVLLMLYAADCAALERHYSSVRAGWTDQAFEEMQRLDTKEITERKEHFGFHDGISQPAIIGLGREKDPGYNQVAAGEFILGFKNQNDQFTSSPTVPAGSDQKGVLSHAGDSPAQADLGRYGTYLVFRQLEQDVRKFWEYMRDKTACPVHPGAADYPGAAEGHVPPHATADSTHPRATTGSVPPHATADSAPPHTTDDPTEMIHLASKIVGRWPSGAPLELCPLTDNPSLDKRNDFTYIPHDEEGLRCPFGAHVRRTNPRDSINRGDATSIKVSKQHRILRRGRSYGPPLAPSMKPEDILRAKDDGQTRGLYFICLNADLNRQFEFVQNFWVNNPKFDGLYDEKDPLTGNNDDPQTPKKTGTFSIPCDPVRQRFTDLPDFVTVKGGAYFFLPGIRALTYLSSI